MQAAIAAHNEVAKGIKRISGHATAYSFRHARISELLQIYGVDPIDGRCADWDEHCDD